MRWRRLRIINPTSLGAPPSRPRGWRPALRPALDVTLTTAPLTGAVRLRGLPASRPTYLAKQLRDFASGVRANAVMTPIAKALSSEDTANVAAYYASVNAPFLPLKNAAPMLVERGKQLAKVGDAAKDLQSCNNCHGPGGAGEPPAIPYLAGQYARYIAFQLTMWKRGFRKNSPDAMADVAKRLDTSRRRGSRRLLPTGQRLDAGGDAA